MLQRGFRIPGGSKKKKKSAVWVYEAGQAPRIELVKDIGAEDYFYSKPSQDGSTTLDEKIRSYENSLSSLLSNLKSCQIGVPVDPVRSSEVVTHLTIRNAHFRRTFAHGFERFFMDLTTLLKDQAALRPIMGVDSKAPSPQLVEAVNKELDENPAFPSLGVPRRVFHQMGQMILKEQFNRFFSEQVPAMIFAFDEVAQVAPDLMKETHNKLLSESVAPERHVEKLAAMEWCVFESNADEFILPDCVALGADDKPGWKPFLLTDLASIKFVLLPVSSTRMLVGRRAGEPPPDLSVFNQAAAASSSAHFIASKQSEEFERYQATIGALSRKFVEGAVSRVFEEFNETRQGLEVRDSEGEDHGQPQSNSPSGPPNYNVNFLGFQSEDAAKRVAATLYSITAELSRLIPLERLDGFTFANDYPAALKGLDRGCDAGRTIEPSDLPYATSVAMPVTVIRGGIKKAHIVMRDFLAYDLMCDEEDKWRRSLHIVVDQVWYAACLHLTQESSEKLLAANVGSCALFLYSHVEEAWSGYFSARISAAFYPEAESGYRDLLISALDAASADIPNARYDYRFHGNLDGLLELVSPRIRDILRFCGRVLGHNDGLGKGLLEDRELAQKLEEIGLLNWWILFDAELSELFSRQGRWANFEDFLHLNRHAERLLWHFGFIPWETDNGEVRVEVPIGTDAHRLCGTEPNQP